MSVKTDTRTAEEVVATTQEGFTDEEDPERHSYVAIDGVKPTDISDEQADLIEEHLVTFLLTKTELPVTDVRVIRGDRGAVEFPLE